MISVAVQSVAARPGVRQLAKFCIVGASSFAIDLGLLNLLLFGMGWPVIAAKTLSFMCGVANGFYWNRRWTFKSAQGDVRKQYPIFLATNSVGLLLNLTIVTSVILLATHLGVIHANRPVSEIIDLLLRSKGRDAFNPLTINLATVVATVVVTAWNFTAARLWTFRSTSEARSQRIPQANR